jgi:hypothetical protein
VDCRALIVRTQNLEFVQREHPFKEKGVPDNRHA